MELQFEIGTHDRRCAWAWRGDAEPTDDLLTGGESWWNRQGLCRPDDVYRGTAGDEYGDDGVGSRTFQLQFGAAALSVCGYGAVGDLYPGGWRLLPARFGRASPDIWLMQVGGPSGRAKVNQRAPCQCHHLRASPPQR